MRSCIETTSSSSDAAADIARAARRASLALAKSTTAQRTQALHAVAAAVRAAEAEILAANARDLEAAAEGGLSPAMVDRLRLSPERVAGVAAAVAAVADLPDLVGRIEREEVRPNGLRIARMRIPLGVVLMIYESRPNVTTDAAALCLKAGNAVILRGGSEAFHSNRALGAAVTAGLAATDLPEQCVQVVASTERELMNQLLACDEDIDLVIPRGGEGLIHFVAEHSRIPVLKHYKGVCHLYVHEAADLDMAVRVAENGKVQRPGVCNAVETILVDRAVADRFVPALCQRFSALGVEIRGDERTRVLGGEAVAPASEDDWHAEYLAPIVAVRVVDDFDDAVAHIERYGSNHTESIITADAAVGERFLREVQSSTVMVNASTRFADGGQLGLGAEIGISTTKLHAYGPMGAEGLTTTKFIVHGDGHVRT
ncbi:glutamate-5-semialdehyde dehydrogenase [Haliangium sp.]|uniref:glutamate-5-semialdehyde dehydrogenase n=1 Tax=Haliangium sp. TaxID=2663208 RepID=UPI003D0A72F3